MLQLQWYGMNASIENSLDTKPRKNKSTHSKLIRLFDLGSYFAIRHRCGNENFHIHVYAQQHAAITCKLELVYPLSEHKLFEDKQILCIDNEYACFTEFEHTTPNGLRGYRLTATQNGNRYDSKPFFILPWNTVNVMNQEKKRKTGYETEKLTPDEKTARERALIRNLIERNCVRFELQTNGRLELPDFNSNILHMHKCRDQKTRAVNIEIIIQRLNGIKNQVRQVHVASNSQIYNEKHMDQVIVNLNIAINILEQWAQPERNNYEDLDFMFQMSQSSYEEFASMTPDECLVQERSAQKNLEQSPTIRAEASQALSHLVLDDASATTSSQKNREKSGEVIQSQTTEKVTEISDENIDSLIQSVDT